LGSDNLKINKNNEFIIYQGSHGDRGAEIADVILPSPAYTEQEGLYSNLEGRVQQCRKASYPTGEALEDWKIFNLISKNLDNNELIQDYALLKKEALEQIPSFSKIDHLPNKKLNLNKKKNSVFTDQVVNINIIDYYYTNAISRSSKTMAECRVVKNKTLKDGTNN